MGERWEENGGFVDDLGPGGDGTIKRGCDG